MEPEEGQLELLKPILFPNQLIFDAGCGPGTYGKLLAQEGNEVVGIAISAETVRVAKKRAKKNACDFSPSARN